MSILNKKVRSRWLSMGSLVLAGESIYMLPYLRKTFQTSMEAVLELSSTEVGLLNSLFGILAVACYFPSGWLADRFSLRRLLTFSLLSTSAGGFLMLTLPSYPVLLGIHAFWGISSILTFWSALIKATRSWGDARSQGKSFGILDGGRGVLAALLASLATTVFAIAPDTRSGFQHVLWVYSLAPAIAGILVWFVVPDSSPGGEKKQGASSNEIKTVLANRRVWMLALVIFCAYVLYLGSFDFPAFAEKAYGKTKTFGATLGTVRDWMRPFAALGAGLLADRIRASRTVAFSFILLMISFGSFYFIDPAANILSLLWIQILISAIAVFALRGVYFALLQQLGIPWWLTGTTVGFVSFIGFMPDMFAHLLSGWFVDEYSGILGYQYYFLVMALVAAIGLVTAWRIDKMCK